VLNFDGGTDEAPGLTASLNQGEKHLFWEEMDIDWGVNDVRYPDLYFTSAGDLYFRINNDTGVAVDIGNVSVYVRVKNPAGEVMIFSLPDLQ